MEDNNGTDAVTSPPSTPESEDSTFAPTPLDNKEDQSENKEGGNNSKSGGSKKQEGKGKKGKGGIKKGKGWKEADEKQQTIKDPWNKNETETETDETNAKNNFNGYDESTEGKDQTKGNGVTEKEDYGKYEYVEKDTSQNKWWWG